MKASLNWIRELHPEVKASAQVIAQRLTFAGVEVEGLHALADDLAGVITAEVVGLSPHPDADHLRVAQVFDGERTHTVVCGAPNVAQGQKVALAQLGTSLPNGVKMERRKIRGVESEGMICSAAELGLSDDAQGIMVLPAKTKPGKPLAAALGIDDVVLEVSPTPNRPDVLSHFGLAREIAALMDLSPPELAVELEDSKPAAATLARVSIAAPERCPKYVARVVRGVKLGPSPAHLQARLRALGQRPISNVVDATNLVLLELGHPLHAFDLDKLPGGELVVRTARAGEKLTTLDGVERVLSEDDVVIADHQAPVALGGVMGGLSTAVSEGTVNLLLEAALFDPKSVRRTSKRLSLHTEASHHFERGADPQMIEAAVDRCAALIVEVAGGTVAKGRVAVAKGLPKPKVVGVRPSRASLVIGHPLDKKRVRRALTALGLEPVAKGPGGKRPGQRIKGKDLLYFQVPSWRVDLTREEDLIEEVARVEGMDAVPTLMPPSSPAVWATAVAPPDPERILRTTLAAEGYLEAVSLAFCSRKDAELLGLDVKSAVEVANPLGEESALLRPSLLPALLRAVRHNQDVLPSIVDLRLFELGRTFEWATPPGELPVETARVALVLRGHRTVERWNTKGEGGAHPQLDAYDLKAAVESALAAFRVQDVTLSVDRTPWLHPGSATALSKDGRALGVFGQLHPEVMDRAGIEGPPVWVAELMLDALVACAGAQPIYQPLPRHPPARRDLSFYLGREVQAADVVATLRAAPVPGMSVEDVEIFDVYEGQGVPAGKRSMAVAITYRAPDRTLTDAEVKAAEASVIGLLVERHAAEIRMA